MPGGVAQRRPASWPRPGLVLQWVGALAIWLVLVPAMFIVLYSVIELQSASKRALKDSDASFANLQVLSLADGLAAQEARIDEAKSDTASIVERQRQLRQALDTQRVEIARQRALLRQDVMSVAVQDDLPMDAQSCNSSIDILGKCAAGDETACAQDWETIEGCYYKSLSLLGRRGPAGVAEAKQAALRLSAATQAGFAYNSIARASNEYGAIAKDDSAEIAAAEAEETRLSHDPLKAVADSYRIISVVPGVRLLFLLPSGVSVALFTGLMAAVGSAIGAVSTRLTPSEPSASGVQVAFLRPLIGGLAGFTVFFVVAAGAAFLVQPNVKDATSAINDLSAPALGALGIFAGLASDTALTWLRGKAKAFFTN
jgi:hypothetical protein